MQISTKHGFTFLCTPKCASTSITAAIGEFCNISYLGHPKLKHVNARFYSSAILPALKQLLPSVKLESFCLMRDPLKRIESWYSYGSRKALKNTEHKNHRNYTGDISFDDFVEKLLSSNIPLNLQTQYDFMRLDNGSIGVDRIFLMDQIEAVSDYSVEKTGKNIVIPTINVSKKRAVRLDSELEGKLRHYLRMDIKLYDFVKRHGGFERLIHSDELDGVIQNRA